MPNKHYTIYKDNGIIIGHYTAESYSLADEYARSINSNAIPGFYDKFYYKINKADEVAEKKDDLNVTVVNLNVPANDEEFVIFRNIPADIKILHNQSELGTTTSEDTLELSFDKYNEGIHHLVLYNENYTLSSSTFELTAYEI